MQLSHVAHETDSLTQSDSYVRSPSISRAGNLQECESIATIACGADHGIW